MHNFQVHAADGERKSLSSSTLHVIVPNSIGISQKSLSLFFSFLISVEGIGFQEFTLLYYSQKQKQKKKLHLMFFFEGINAGEDNLG